GFFFSSRRRHTRWPRDWSSDVCSSDLAGILRRVSNEALSTIFQVRSASKTLASSVITGMRTRSAAPMAKTIAWLPKPAQSTRTRSEERRVGKEWRWGGAEQQENRRGVR